MKRLLTIDMQALRGKVKEIKKNIAVMGRAATHPRTPWYARLFILIVLAYALSPIDLIPDFIPVLGYLDDLLLIPAGIILAVKMIPDDIITECRTSVNQTDWIQGLGKWGAGFVGLVWMMVLLGVVGKLGLSLPHPEKIINYLALFAGGFVAAAISGAAGFGGALLLLPLLVNFLGTTLAIPVLTIAQLIGNLSRVGFGFRVVAWTPVFSFTMGAIPMAVLGAYSFVNAPQALITRLVGLGLVVFVVLKYFNLLKIRPGTGSMFLGGCVVGLVSGLVGSAGPLGAAMFFSAGLAPVAYIASEAVTAVAIHVAKIVIYQKYLAMGSDILWIGLFIGLAMILGTWAGKRLIEKMPQEKFVKLVGILLLLVGLQMLIWA